jgi:hypothetical protein
MKPLEKEDESKILWTYIEFECVIQGMGGGHLIFGSATNEQAAKKKCKERELLKLAYWKINRPK